MPKLKTHSGTKDRVKLSKTGKVQTRHSHRSHFLQKKSGNRKRTFAGTDTLVGKQVKTIKTLLGVK